MMVQGAVGHRITGTVQLNGAAYNISGRTNTMRMQYSTGASATFTLSNVTDGTDGQWQYVTTAASDLLIQGPVQIQITSSDGSTNFITTAITSRIYPAI